MRQEPIEFGKAGLATRAARERISRLAWRLLPRMHPPIDRGVDVIDAAFAGLIGPDSSARRIDLPRTALSSPPEDAAAESPRRSAQQAAQRELVADLSAELAALDRQRERLMRLLSDVEPSESTS